MTRKQLAAKLAQVFHAKDLNARLEENIDHDTTKEKAIMEAFHAACDVFPRDSYHDDEIIADTLESALTEYGSPDDEVSEDDIADDLTECADSATPIYYNKIAAWFADGNWTAIDDYIAETGTPDEFDIMKTIQCAYCYTLEQAARQLLSAIVQACEDDEAKEQTRDDREHDAFMSGMQSP